MTIVATLVAGPVAMFELSVACEVFGLDRSELGVEWYEHRVCAAVDGPLRSPEGIEVIAPFGLDGAADADILIVPAWPADMRAPEPALEVLRAAHRRGARVMSFCSGLFALGAAGLVDDRPCTTHWMHAAAFSEAYPKARLQPDVLYVDDGDILSSAGTAAAIDLCLHVVRAEHGAAIANAVARRMVVPPHRDGGQAQFVQAAVPHCTDDGLAPLLSWVVEHLDEPHTVAGLARRASLSPRTFARRFRDATGTTPHQWLLQQRIGFAQQLLEETELAVEEVARRAGFGSAAALRLHFQRVVSASPLAYRRTFQQRASA